MSKKAEAMINSLKTTDRVTIVHEYGVNDVVAEYKGTRCTAIFNAFTGMYYVDDVYGVLKDPHQCPKCNGYVP